MTKFEYATNLAFFLMEKTGSVVGTFEGKMTAAEQRALFGAFLGKGKICIDGEKETICNRVRVAFGMDCDDRNVTSWNAL